MPQPLISVIVPVYNVDKYLSKCIDSIVNQDFVDFELLLVDDGSTDNSLAICNEFACRDNRITVVANSHMGVSATRNKGLDVACGRYVVFVDSDDWIERTHLSDFFRQPFDEDKVTIVIQPINFYFLDGTSSRFLHYGTDVCVTDNFAESIAENRVLHNGCPVAELLDLKIIKENNLRFDTRLSTWEDVVFIFDYLLFAEQIIISCVPTYHYMRYSGNVTLSTKGHSAETYIFISQMLMARIEQLVERYELQPYSDYLDCINYDMGFGQIVTAIFSAKCPSEYCMVIEAFNKNDKHFRKYMSEDGQRAKMVKKLLKLPRWGRHCYFQLRGIKRAVQKMFGKPL